MRPYHILLVEDAPDILAYNMRRLQAEGYRVSAAPDLTRARRILAETPPDLVVLDVLLPDGSGLDFCADLRACSIAPVLFLTCLGESEQIVRGLRAGGDDYIVKPYRFAELLSRIEAQLRRTHLLARAALTGSEGPLTLDAQAQRACLQGRDLGLKPKEYQLLALLLQGRNRYATPEALYADVWGMAAGGDVRTVRVHLSSLRKKLGEASGGRATIDCSRTRGYRLELEEDDNV